MIGSSGEAKNEAARRSASGNDKTMPAIDGDKGKELLTEEAQQSNFIKSEFQEKMSERKNAGDIPSSSTSTPVYILFIKIEVQLSFQAYKIIFLFYFSLIKVEVDTSP